jgi:tetratricopeptide (TPR) repeat protein
LLGKKNQSALLAKYYSMYKKNPGSKVFAPLAESFRKLGMLDDAFKILKEGIRFHPQYTLGYIVLANCYYDQEKYELTYNTLRPIINQNADNISLQKIFAQACIHLGYLEEALETYKYLLFMNPQDKFFAAQVKKLEDDLMVGHKKLSLDQIVKAPNLPEIAPSPIGNDADWVQVDFNKTNFEEKTKPAFKLPQLSPESNEDEWVVKKPGLESHPILQKDAIAERSLEDEFYADEFEEDHGEIDIANEHVGTSESPLVSHTLIDLYCAQNYFDKALELLYKIVELNPHDSASQEKIKQIKMMKEAAESLPPKTTNKITEQDGHDELISIIENQVKARSPKEIKLQSTFDLFLNEVKIHSQLHR